MPNTFTFLEFNFKLLGCTQKNLEAIGHNKGNKGGIECKFPVGIHQRIKSEQFMALYHYQYYVKAMLHTLQVFPNRGQGMCVQSGKTAPQIF